MKFEELENLWAGQTVAATRLPDFAEGQRKMLPELNRRGRFLSYSLGGLGLFFVVYPLLSVANYRARTPDHPTLFWLNMAVHMAFFTTLFFWALRLRERHRELRRQSAGSLREVAEVSQRNAEAEMREYRMNVFVVPIMVGMTLLSIFANQPAGAGAAWLALRLSITLGFYGLVTGIFALHYHANLKPTHARWTDILRQLERA